jgi:hypothetical protein
VPFHYFGWVKPHHKSLFPLSFCAAERFAIFVCASVFWSRRPVHSAPPVLMSQVVRSWDNLILPEGWSEILGVAPHIYEQRP